VWGSYVPVSDGRGMFSIAVIDLTHKSTAVIRQTKNDFPFGGQEGNVFRQWKLSGRQVFFQSGGVRHRTLNLYSRSRISYLDGGHWGTVGIMFLVLKLLPQFGAGSNSDFQSSESSQEFLSNACRVESAMWWT